MLCLRNTYMFKFIVEEDGYIAFCNILAINTLSVTGRSDCLGAIGLNIFCINLALSKSLHIFIFFEESYDEIII